MTRTIILVFIILSGGLRTFAQTSGDLTPSNLAGTTWKVIWPMISEKGVIVSGTVQDLRGAVIPEARLKLTANQGPAVYQASSDAAGVFRFEAVMPGTYTLTCSADNFRKAEIPVTVSGQPVVDLRMELEVKAREETVTVSGSSRQEESLVTMDRNGDRLNFDEDLLQALPSTGSDPLSSISRFLSPSAQAGEGITLEVDGAEVGSLNLPGGALRRVRINRNPYSAKSRRPGRSSIEVYSEEGSFRRYRGRFSLYARNSVFDARNPFARTRPDMSSKLIESNIGGHFARKRASFFVSGERLINDENQVVNALTLNGPVMSNAPTPERRTNLLGRLEVRAGQSHTLLALYSYLDHSRRNRGVGGLRLAETGYDQSQGEHRFQFSDRMIISSNLLNDLRIVIERETESRGRMAGNPRIIVKGAFTGGDAPNFSSERATKLRFQDNVSYTSGNHQIKFGADIRPVWLTVSEASNFGGTLEYANLERYAAQMPYVVSINTGQPEVSFTQHEAFFFFQDEIRVRQNLTLSPGIRYNRQSNLDDNNNFAPRLAIAYGFPDQKTVVRAGAGIFYERVTDEIRMRTLLYDGERIKQFVITNPLTGDLPLPSTSSAVKPSVVRTESGLSRPYIFQASLSIERELWKGSNLAVEYQTSRGSHLLRSRNINAPIGGLRPDPAFFNINQVESSASSRSQALNVTWRGSLGKVFHGMAQYTLSRSEDDTGGRFDFPANNYDLLPEWGRSDFDARHRFNLAGSIDRPDGWIFGAFVTLSSSVPYNISTGNDDNLDSIANDRPAGTSRNTGIGAGLAQVDLRVTRLFRMPRIIDRGRDSTSRNLEISVDFMNIFNRVNYDEFIGVVGSPFFGRPNSARQPRTIQFSTRYKF